MTAEAASSRRPVGPAATLPALLLLLAAGCGGSGSGQQGSAFVFLSVDGFSVGGQRVSSVASSIDDPNASTTVCVTLRNQLKNPTVTTATGLDDVVVEAYVLTLTRLDGVSVPGSPFTFGTAVRVPAGTSDNTASFVAVAVPGSVKRDPALRQAQLPLNATAQFVFRGRDGRGQRVEAEAALSVVFLRDSADTAATC